MTELQIGGKYGTLTIEDADLSSYYKFLKCRNLDNKKRMLVTRGPGKEKGATRVPIRMPGATASEVLRYAKIHQIDMRKDAWRAFKGWWKEQAIHPGLQGHILSFLRVPLVLMPRGGSLDTGLEWNAPGGTGELGESFDQIGSREFSEEAEMSPFGVHYEAPPGMPASGIYDEVQHVTFALVTGTPTALEEGAKEWISIPLTSFRNWARAQNSANQPGGWEKGEYIPVDLKVIDALWWLTENIGLGEF